MPRILSKFPARTPSKTGIHHSCLKLKLSFRLMTCSTKLMMLLIQLKISSTQLRIMHKLLRFFMNSPMHRSCSLPSIVTGCKTSCLSPGLRTMTCSFRINWPSLHSSGILTSLRSNKILKKWKKT